MHIKIECNTLTVQKEKGDPRIKRSGYAGTGAFDSASQLFYHIAKRLNAAGCDLIKKRMGRDGHLVNDEQQYLRTRNAKSKGPHIYISDGHYATRCAAEDFNKGEAVKFMISVDVFEKQPDCKAKLESLAIEVWRQQGRR